MFECHMRGDVVNAENRRRKTVISLQKFRHKCALPIDFGRLSSQWRHIRDTFDASDASCNPGKSEINRARTERFQMPHSEPAKSTQFIFLDCERNRTFRQEAYRKRTVNARDTENGTMFHIQSPDADDFTVRTKRCLCVCRRESVEWPA